MSRAPADGTVFLTEVNITDKPPVHQSNNTKNWQQQRLMMMKAANLAAQSAKLPPAQNLTLKYNTTNSKTGEPRVTQMAINGDYIHSVFYGPNDSQHTVKNTNLKAQTAPVIREFRDQPLLHPNMAKNFGESRIFANIPETLLQPSDTLSDISENLESQLLQAQNTTEELEHHNINESKVEDDIISYNETRSIANLDAKSVTRSSNSYSHHSSASKSLVSKNSKTLTNNSKASSKRDARSRSRTSFSEIGTDAEEDRIFQIEEKLRRDEKERKKVQQTLDTLIEKQQVILQKLETSSKNSTSREAKIKSRTTTPVSDKQSVLKELKELHHQIKGIYSNVAQNKVAVNEIPEIKRFTEDFLKKHPILKVKLERK